MDHVQCVLHTELGTSLLSPNNPLKLVHEPPPSNHSILVLTTKTHELTAAVSDLDASYAAYRNVKDVLVSSSMALEEPFRTFYCPLSGKIMKDPVMTNCHSVYERDEITRWFLESRLHGHVLEDPLTKQRLLDDSLSPAVNLWKAINEWKQRNTLARIIKAKPLLLDDAQRLKALDTLVSICQLMPMAKEWIVYEGIFPLIVSCLMTRRLEVKKSTFILLRLLVTDDLLSKEAMCWKECIVLASGSLLREPPMLEAALLLKEIAKWEHGHTRIGQEQCVMVAIVTCAMTVKDIAVKETVHSLLTLLSDTDELVMKMARANWWSPLLTRLNQGLAKRKLAMISFLAEVPLGEESIGYLVQNGVVSVLCATLNSDQGEDLKDAALRALHKLSSEHAALHHMVEEGLVPFLVDSFSGDRSPAVGLCAARILENLMAKCGVGYLIQTCGPASVLQLVSNLIDVLGDLRLPVTSGSVHINLLKVLLEMALPAEGCSLRGFMRGEQGCLEVLLTLLKSEVAQVCVSALELLSLLCDGKDGIPMSLLLLKNVRPLLSLLENDSATLEVRNAVTGVLTRLPQMEAVPVSQNALSTLVNLCRVSNAHGQMQAVAALLLFMQEPEAMQYLAQEDFIVDLVQMLSSSSSVAKVKAAKALKEFSMCQRVDSSKKHAFGLYNSWKLCPVHKTRCKVDENCCIVKAGAVPKLIAMLEDPSLEVAEAALDVLSTLLGMEAINVGGARLLDDLGVVDKLLHLATSKSVICSEKCLMMLEKIFLVPEIRSRYVSVAKKALLSLTGCQQSQRVCQKAASMLSQLG